MLEVALRLRRDGFLLDAAFSAPTPGIVAIFGPSGAGKSSLLAAIAGLIRPEAARIVVNGTVLADSARGIDLPAQRRRLGVVFQDGRLFPHLSVAANLRYGLNRAPPGPVGFDAVVEVLALGDLLDRRPDSLSGGERQRVALGRALLAQPHLLLLDEPMAALDQPRRAQIMAFLEALRDRFEIPMLLVTHAIDEVIRLADTLVLLEAGQVRAMGPLTELAARPDLPLLGGRSDAGAVLLAQIVAHHPDGLTRLSFPGGSLIAQRIDRPVGASVRLRVQARDIVLATEAPRAISVHNILPATVTALTPQPGGVAVGLDLGGTALFARIASDTVARLDLRPGAAVFALIKSVALDAGAGGGEAA